MAEPNQSTPPPPDAQQEIAQAAAEKAAAGGSQEQVADAAQQAAKAQGYELTDAQAKQIADQMTGPVVAGLIAEFDKRGVFRDEPAPVAPPEQATAATPPASAEPAADVQPADAVQEPASTTPRRPSWAEKHFGA